MLSASSGVGTAAIQVAKRVAGARVIATTSTPEKAEQARALGADEVIVYTQEEIAERIRALTAGRGVDLVVDHVGSDFWEASFASLAPGGRYGVCGVTTGYRAQLHLGQLFTRQLTLFGVFMASRDDLTEVLDARRRGLVRGVVAARFPLAQAAEAHRTMEERGAFGKLLLTIG